MISTNTPVNIQKDTVKFLRELVRKGGPELHEYQIFTDIVNHLKPEQIDPFREIIKPSLNENTLIGHGFVKPYGYPGDFYLIHHIYEQKANADPKFRSWDEFFLNQPAAQAVRNRKDFFLRQLRHFEENGSDEINVLILGCGPATDVKEYTTDHPATRIRFSLVDFDQKAIDFAKSQNTHLNGNIDYFRINVLRYKPYKYYNLIWSAGLFDYFKEKHFIYLINKYRKNLAENGEFIIGNFSHSNPTRKLMEVLSDWHLNHRSKYDLIRMANEAEVEEGRISVEMEELGINLFLRIKNNVNDSS
jgi:SAM-dependent methyltransferase